MWAFLDHDGVEPTNNAGEGALRHAVIWRKPSVGTQSERGSRFVETMPSVIGTCRQQKRDVFRFVTAADLHQRGRVGGVPGRVVLGGELRQRADRVCVVRVRHESVAASSLHVPLTTRKYSTAPNSHPASSGSHGVVFGFQPSAASSDSGRKYTVTACIPGPSSLTPESRNG